MTPTDLAEIERLEREAFRAPWTYSEWEVECPCDGDPGCANKECDGAHVPCTTIESPDEYPGGQVVAQFQVPGLSCLADKNGELIVALRNHAAALITLARPGMAARDFLEEHGGLLRKALDSDASGTFEDEWEAAERALESLLKEAGR